MLLNPKKETFANFDPKTRELFQKMIQFFENKGRANYKKEDHEAVWYTDYLDFIKKEKIFYYFLTPPEYGDSPDCRWDSHRNSAFSEILGFYSLSHWYAWQVSILGLGPIWIGKNEKVKKRTAEFLKNGGVFAFGLSEKEHGADLISSDMELIPQGNGNYIARGDKYYIGNGNCASYVSVFAKDTSNKEYVFFVVESGHPKYECIKNTVHSQMFVSEFYLHDYPLTDNDNILLRGREAWDATLSTVAFAKFNLGPGSTGIATHAFFEAIQHAANRKLYGQYVTDFPHIRELFVEAYARLTAMRLFTYRANDFMIHASAEDRRYLLFNPMEKMKVTMQGEKVIDLIWDIIAARGFEKDMYFESAARYIRALPKLEGTAHVNMVLVIKFMMNYLFEPQNLPDLPRQKGGSHNNYLFNQGATTKGLDKVHFQNYEKAYSLYDTPNIKIFKTQIEALKAMLSKAPLEKEQQRDLDFMLTLGEIFTTIPYGALILEAGKTENVNPDIIDQIFEVQVKDITKYASDLYTKSSMTPEQSKLCMELIKKPARDSGRYLRVWGEVHALKDAYEMNP